MLRCLEEKDTDIVFVEHFKPHISQRKLPVHYWYHVFITGALVEAGTPTVSTAALQCSICHYRQPGFLAPGPGLYKQEWETEIRKIQVIM